MRIKIIYICLFLVANICFGADITKLPPLKHPILLVHGATMGGGELRIGPVDFGKYFLGIPEFLESSKTKVYTLDLPSDATIEECAMVIQAYLGKQLYGQTVNIIAHSLGGLDARYLASVLKSQQIASITTIGTPHRGTPLADWGEEQVKLKGVWYRFFLLTGYDIGGRRFLKELTTEFMQKRFNPRVPDRPDVKYYSVVATDDIFSSRMSLMLYPTYLWLRSMGTPMSQEPNDGLVPASSQEWGTVIARLPLDHLAQMGHDSLRFATLTGESLALYATIFERLQKDGL